MHGFLYALWVFAGLYLIYLIVEWISFDNGQLRQHSMVLTVIHILVSATLLFGAGFWQEFKSWPEIVVAVFYAIELVHSCYHNGSIKQSRYEYYIPTGAFLARLGVFSFALMLQYGWI